MSKGAYSWHELTLQACRDKRPIAASAGSVLLETVIVIPLFMLLIGGILWIGQLTYDKQKMVTADRYVAWNVGNWHSSGGEDVQDILFPKGRYGGYEIVGRITPRKEVPAQWWCEAYAGVGLQVSMPDWTKGWFAADAAMNGRSMLDSVVVIRGRDIPPGKLSGQYEGHVVLMRSGWIGTRADMMNPSGVLTVDYQGIYDETWPPTGGRQ